MYNWQPIGGDTSDTILFFFVGWPPIFFTHFLFAPSDFSDFAPHTHARTRDTHARQSHAHVSSSILLFFLSFCLLYIWWHAWDKGGGRACLPDPSPSVCTLVLLPWLFVCHLIFRSSLFFLVFSRTQKIVKTREKNGAVVVVVDDGNGGWW